MKLISKFLLAAALLTGTGYTYAKPVATVMVSPAETQDRHLSGFNGINVAGSFDVFYYPGIERIC